MLELTDGLGADVAIEAVGVPQTFELCAELVRPGGTVANVGVHGKPATLHLEKLWIKDVTITTGLVDTSSTPRLLELIRAGRLDPTVFVTHRFELGDTEEAYNVFANAAETNALKVVLCPRSPWRSSRGRWPRPSRSDLLRCAGTEHDPCRRSCRCCGFSAPASGASPMSGRRLRERLLSDRNTCKRGNS